MQTKPRSYLLIEGQQRDHMTIIPRNKIMHKKQQCIISYRYAPLRAAHHAVAAPAFVRNLGYLPR